MGSRKLLEFMKYFLKDLMSPLQVRNFGNFKGSKESNFVKDLTKLDTAESNNLLSANKLRKDDAKTKEAQLRSYSSGGDKPSQPLSRHHYHEEVETAVNNQILAEFNAGYAYLSMSCYFARSDVALTGTSSFFLQMYREEVEHALAFINHQNLRGGHVKLCAITTVECSDWCSIHKALEVSLEMEKLILDKLIDLVRCAEKHNDINTQDVITSIFIKEGQASIMQLAGLLSRINKLGLCGMSEYFFDKELSTSYGHNSK